MLPTFYYREEETPQWVIPANTRAKLAGEARDFLEEAPINLPDISRALARQAAGPFLPAIKVISLR